MKYVILEKAKAKSKAKVKVPIHLHSGKLTMGYRYKGREVKTEVNKIIDRWREKGEYLTDKEAALLKKFTQDYFKTHNLQNKHARLYKGLQKGKTEKDIPKYSSWSIDKGVAWNFANEYYGTGGKVIKRGIPVSKIVAWPEVFPQLKAPLGKGGGEYSEEWEVIVER